MNTIYLPCVVSNKLKLITASSWSFLQGILCMLPDKG